MKKKSIEQIKAEKTKIDLASKAINNIFANDPETKMAYKEAKEIDVLLRMVDLNVSLQHCWVINETFKLYLKKKSQFDLNDSSIIVAKSHELFNP